MIKVRLNEVTVACAAFLAVATNHNVIATITPATSANVVSGGAGGNQIVNTSYYFNGNLSPGNANTIIFIAHDGPDDGEGPTGGDGVLAQRNYTISTNTWGAKTTIYDPGAGKNCMAASCFAVGTGGERWCFFSEFNSGHMSDACVIRRIKSQDYGATWGAPDTIKTYSSAFSQPTNLIVFQNNASRMLLAISGYNSPYLQLLESLDGGVTFPNTKTVYSGASGLSEMGVINLDDVHGIAVIRDDAGGRLLAAYSADGLNTWGAPVSTGLGAATGQKVQPRIRFAAGRNDMLELVFYDRGDSRQKWQSTTLVVNALANLWSATYLLGSSSGRGYGDIISIDVANVKYLVTNDKEISAGQCDQLWFTVKDIYANSLYAAPFMGS